MIPTLTNSPEIGTTLFIIFLCIVGMYLSIQLSKAIKKIIELEAEVIYRVGVYDALYKRCLANKTTIKILQEK